MSWFYNSYSGELTHASGVNALAYQAALHTGVGWHELKIPDSATEAQAAADAVKEVPGGKTPTTSVKTGLGNAVTNNPITKALGGALRWTLNIGNTTGLLSRFLKVVIGGIVLIAGVLKLSNTDKKLEEVLPLIGGPAGKVLKA